MLFSSTKQNHIFRIGFHTWKSKTKYERNHTQNVKKKTQEIHIRKLF